MTKNRKTGRPSKLKPELVRELTALLRAGAMIDAACAAVGISEASFFGWIRRGRDETQGPHAEFFKAIKKALADAENSLVAGIRQAGKQQWQALAWLLERRFRDRWDRELPPTQPERASVTPPIVKRRDDDDE